MAVIADHTTPSENAAGQPIHLRAHLAFRLEDVGDTYPHGFLPLSPRVVHHDGSPSLGAIATMVDVVGMRSIGHQGPMVTSHLALRFIGRPTDGELHASGRSVREGKTGGTSIIDVVGHDGQQLGVATVTGTALTPGPGSGTHVKRSTGDGDFFTRWPRPVDGPHPEDFIGWKADGHTGDAFRYRMPFHEPLRNINGVLHGGAACLIAEQAARCAGRDAGAHKMVIESLDMHFLAPGLIGPFTASVELVPSSGARRAVTVEVFDAGRDERRVALGLLTGSFE